MGRRDGTGRLKGGQQSKKWLVTGCGREIFFFFFFVCLGGKLEGGYERESGWSSKGRKQNRGTRRKKEEEWEKREKKLGVGDLGGRHLEGGYLENEKRKGRTSKNIILKEDDSSIISRGC